MTITAKYRSRCTHCGGLITPGTLIEWTRGEGSRHVTCPESESETASEPIAVVPGKGARHPKGANRKAGACERCGTWVEVGAGRLEYCVEDSGCPTHHDYSGYHLYCADAAACATAREARLAEQRARREAAARIAAIIPSTWREGRELTERAGDAEADTLRRTAETDATLIVRARRDSEGAIDEGMCLLVGADVLYWHGGYYDDYRSTAGWLRGAAAEYRAAFEAVIPPAEWPAGDKPLRLHGHFIYVTAR